MRLVILVVCCVLSVGFAEELPSFIKKCSLKDPEVSKCIADNGNLAIPELIKGSSFFGVPSATPLRISAINLPGTDFTVSLSDVRLFGLENVKITDVRYDIQDDYGDIFMTVPYLHLTADYIIVSNDFFFPTILEGGRLNTVLAGNMFRYKANATRLSINGEVYLKFAADDNKLQTKRIFYRFTDPYFSNTGDFTEFLNVHKRIIDERIIPAVNTILNRFITTISINLLDKLPRKGYFDDFNPEGGKHKLVFTIPYLNLTADYVTLNSDLFFPELIGGGKLRTSLVEDVFTYTTIGSIIVREDKNYLKLSNFTSSLTTKRIFYHFSNFYASNTGDFQEFLNSHKRIVDERIKPAVQKILYTYAVAALSHLTVKLPVADYFEIFAVGRKQLGANMIVPHLNLTGDYVIITNDLFFPRILGSGQLHTSLDTNLIGYNNTAEMTTIEREIYFDFKDQKVTLQTKRIFYKFFNIYANNPGDFLQVLNGHKPIIDQRIRPAVEEILSRYVVTAISNVMVKQPLRILFDL